MKTLYSVSIQRDSNGYNRAAAQKAYKDLLMVRSKTAELVKAIKQVTGTRSQSEYSYHLEFARSLRENFKTIMDRPRLIVSIIRNDLKIDGRFQIGAGSDVSVAAATRRALSDIRANIRDKRRTQRYTGDPLEQKEPNSILRRHQRKIFQSYKMPLADDKAQYVGIEIECITPRNVDMTPLMQYAKYINVGTDGSIEAGSGETGKEIRVLLKRSEIRDVVPGLMATIAGMGGRVNKSCGLHVHLDQRNNPNPELVFQKLVRSLGLLYTVVPASRRSNRYCARNRSTNFSAAREQTRYRAINAAAYSRYKTLEVRLFGGTLQADKIINWVETLLAIADGKIFNRVPKNFDTARKYWGLSDENLAWLKARQLKLSALNTEPVPVAESDDDVGGRADSADDHEYDEDCSCDHCARVTEENHAEVN